VIIVLLALAAGGGYAYWPRTENRKEIARPPRATDSRRDEIQDKLGDPKELRVDLGNGVTMELVLIQPGTFKMGSPENEEDHESDETQHRVTLTKPFYMGKYEVTHEQYEQIVGENPSSFKGPKFPVERVSWDEAQAFIKKLNAKLGKAARLPSEAEWEYACRAGTTTRFCTGNTAADLARAGWYGAYSTPVGNSEKSTNRVGQKTPNEWGLYDMHGNVWEWCQDWYEDKYYAASPANDPKGPDKGGSRVSRGGSLFDSPGDCRSAFRGNHIYPGERIGFNGFRLLLDF